MASSSASGDKPARAPPSVRWVTKRIDDDDVVRERAASGPARRRVLRVGAAPGADARRARRGRSSAAPRRAARQHCSTSAREHVCVPTSTVVRVRRDEPVAVVGDGRGGARRLERHGVALSALGDGGVSSRSPISPPRPPTEGGGERTARARGAGARRDIVDLARQRGPPPSTSRRVRLSIAFTIGSAVVAEGLKDCTHAARARARVRGAGARAPPAPPPPASRAALVRGAAGARRLGV